MGSKVNPKGPPSTDPWGFRTTRPVWRRAEGDQREEVFQIEVTRRFCRWPKADFAGQRSGDMRRERHQDPLWLLEVTPLLKSVNNNQANRGMGKNKEVERKSYQAHINVCSPPPRLSPEMRLSLLLA